MSEKINFDYKKLHPFKWYILENFPFLEDSIDVLTNYQLFCKLGEMYNKQVDAINTLGVQVEGITDWFDNLDVQDEINNKLDEMAESGKLEEIIASYLNTKALLCFDTIEDLKSADNLTDGCFAKTLGYYSINDGGSAIYKIRTITNDDVVDDMIIIELSDNTLIGELQILNNEININQLGAKPDDETNNITYIQKAINYCITNKINLIFGAGSYAFQGIITVPDTQYGITIKGIGGYTSKIRALNNNSQIVFTNFLRFKIEDLYFVGTGQELVPLIYLNGNSHKSEINNCFFATNMGVLVNNSAYLKLDNCLFNNITGHVTNYLLSIKGEYFYANNCYFEGQNNSSVGSKAVIINAGNNYYFDKCDFCNWNNGNAIEIDANSNSVKDLYIENSTFMRNDVSIHSYCDKGISNFVLDKNVFMFLTGNENKIIYNERRNNTSGQIVYFSGHNFIDGTTIDLTKQMFTSSGWMQNCTLKFSSNIGFPDYDDYFRIGFYANFPNNMLIQSGDQSSKTITILTRSPYKGFNLPTLTPVKYNGLAWTDYTVENTYQGNLTITFNFPGTGAYTQAYLKISDY